MTSQPCRLMDTLLWPIMATFKISWNTVVLKLTFQVSLKISQSALLFVIIILWSIFQNMYIQIVFATLKEWTPLLTKLTFPVDHNGHLSVGYLLGHDPCAVVTWGDTSSSLALWSMMDGAEGGRATQCDSKTSIGNTNNKTTITWPLKNSPGCTPCFQEIHKTSY